MQTCRCSNGFSMNTAGLVLTLDRLHVPPPPPCRSLSLLLYSLARLKVQPPPAWQQQLTSALETHLAHSSSSSSSSNSSNHTPESSSSSSRVHRFSAVDLCLLLWSLPGLQLSPPPPAAALTAALTRSTRHLTELDCSYLTALLVSWVSPRLEQSGWGLGWPQRCSWMELIGMC